MRRVIRLGDFTTHGGHVVQAAGRYTMDGIPVARMGDHCTCPIPGHAGCVIVEGDPHWTIDGKPVALEGHLTSCGAALISSFGRLTRSHEKDALAGKHGASPGQQSARASAACAQHDDCYVLRCAGSGQPLSKIEYAIRRADGSIEHGTTDEAGHTHLLSSTAEEENVVVYIEG